MEEIIQKKKDKGLKQPKYNLRKLSIGVVSCMIGMICMIGFTSVEAHAQEATSSDVAVVEEVDAANAEIPKVTTTDENATVTAETDSKDETANEEDQKDEVVDVKQISLSNTETKNDEIPDVKPQALATPVENTAMATASANRETITDEYDDLPTVEGSLPVVGGFLPEISGHGELTKKDTAATPEMSDANGATVSALVPLTDMIAKEYNMDSTDNHITYAFVELEGLNEKLKVAGDNREIYFTLSLDKNRNAVSGDKSIYVNLWDKTSNTLLETIKMTDPNVNYTSSILQDMVAKGIAVAKDYTFSRNEYAYGGDVRSTVFVYHSVKTSRIHTLYSLTEATKNGLKESDAQFKDTIIASQNTYYMVKNPDGTQTQLGVWTNEGWGGSTYTASGKRDFVGYDLVESPSEDQMTGTIAIKPVVGFTWEDTKKGENESAGRWAMRIGEVVNEEGGIVLKIISASNKEMTEDIRTEFVSDVIYPAGAIKPDGTISTGYATNGPADMSVGGVTYKGGRYNYKNGTGGLKGFKLQNSMFVPSKDVYYFYEKQGKAIVHYVDIDGNVIQDSVIDTENRPNGEEYDTKDNKPNSITKDGVIYYLKETSLTNTVAEKTIVETDNLNVIGNENGNIEANVSKHIIYVYEPAGSVVVHYTDEDGNTIKDNVVDENNVQPGTQYNTTDNKPEVIKTPDGKTYTLVAEQIKGAEQGAVEAGKTTEVTYVYKEVKGNVVVNYTDEDGKVIKDPVTDTDESSTGTDYNTTDNKPEVIKTPDGKTYKLVPEKTKGNETGKVVEGTTEVTYVYYVYKEVKEDTSAKVVENTSSSKIKNLPKTGDISNIGIYGSLLSLSGGLLALLGVKRRKEEEE